MESNQPLMRTPRTGSELNIYENDRLSGFHFAAQITLIKALFLIGLVTTKAAASIIITGPTAALAGLIFGQSVTLHEHGQDRYGRTLAGVSVGKVDVGLSMVGSGMAWHFKRYSKDAGLADAGNAARAAKVGLWADPAPVPPWTWRADKSVRVIRWCFDFSCRK